MEGSADRVLHRDVTKRSELTGGGKAGCVGGAGRENVSPQLHDRRSIELQEADLEQDFLRANRPKRQHVNDVLGISAGDGFGKVGGVFVDKVLGKDVRSV